jgi:hypothetical protein
VSLRDVISVSSKQTAPVTHADLEALHFNTVEDLVYWVGEREARHDAELAAAVARIAKLEAATVPIDLDGEPRPWLNIKRAADRLGVSVETTRMACVTRRFDAKKVAGQWRVFVAADGAPLRLESGN